MKETFEVFRSGTFLAVVKACSKKSEQLRNELGLFPVEDVKLEIDKTKSRQVGLNFTGLGLIEQLKEKEKENA